jgi:20S proteasome subunit alpha 6
MFRSQYDGDISTWSPQGRIHQIEYAMEAVKQGSACVGLKSKKFAVIAALKRSSSELGSFQQKVFRIDDHIGIAIAGLTADARVLSKFMRTECLNHKFVYEAPLQVGRLVSTVADKSQVHTQRYGRRPYGVGLLVIGYDQTGPHLYETSPSGNFYDYKAMAIGARSQSAKTYLEKNFPSFENLTLDELVKHSLIALRETLQSSADGLNLKNCSVGIVGENRNFEILEGQKLQSYLDSLDDTGGSKMETE